MSLRILVASDGKEDARGAVRFAHEMQRRDPSVSVQVIGVLEPAVYGTPGNVYPSLIPAERVDSTRVLGRRKELLEAVGRQVREHGDGRWKVEMLDGRPAPVIAKAAREGEFDLVVMGHPPRSRLQRWLEGDTVLDVLRFSTVPVLAVHPALSELPKRVMVAVDFGRWSFMAAKEAAELFGGVAEVHLVHVLDDSQDEAEEWERTYREGALSQLETLSHELREVGGETAITHLLTGDVAVEITALAEQLEAGLVATGSHGFGFFGRLLLGSVSSKLMRSGHFSMLVVPPLEEKDHEILQRSSSTEGVF